MTEKLCYACGQPESDGASCRGFARFAVKCQRCALQTFVGASWYYEPATVLEEDGPLGPRGRPVGGSGREIPVLSCGICRTSLVGPWEFIRD